MPAILRPGSREATKPRSNPAAFAVFVSSRETILLPAEPMPAIRDPRGIVVDSQAYILSRRFHEPVSVFGCWFHRHTRAARLLLQEKPASPGTNTFYFPRGAARAAIMSR